MILDIKTLAETCLKEVRTGVSEFSGKPHLVIIMVGNNSASEVYVRNKIRTCEEVGMTGTLIHLKDTTQEELIKKIETMNHDKAIHGILVQSPLPENIDAEKIFDTIVPEKDVDGFSSINISKLYKNQSGIIPGTPKGIMRIIESQTEIMGKHVIVVGKSTIVGKPLALLLLHAGATVTLCHSKTRNLAKHTKEGDIVVAATGKKHLITADMIKPGSLVIDVGITVDEQTKKISGDCDTENIAKIADITPVPGGVGPMTIAMLLTNVLLAYKLQGNK